MEPPFGRQDGLQHRHYDQTGDHREHGVTRQRAHRDLRRPNDIGDPPMPEILDYERQIRPEIEKRLGRDQV